MSALVISAVLMFIALGGSLSGFFSRMNAVNTEYKEHSYALARACVSQSLLALANNPSYTGAATTTVSGEDASCHTGPITVSGTTPNNEYSFSTRSYYEDAYTTLSAKVDAETLSLISVGEEAN